MDQKGARNAFIAVSIFGLLLFTISTINSYQDSMASLNKPTTNIKNSLMQGILDKSKFKDYPEYNGTVISKEEMGNAAWKLLHLMSIHISDVPTKEQQDRLKLFLVLFAEFFPCRECGQHFQQMLIDHPPETETKEKFAMYMCDIHNIVNKRLQKDEFDCANLYKKYGGDCGCGDDKQT